MREWGWRRETWRRKGADEGGGLRGKGARES